MEPSMKNKYHGFAGLILLGLSFSGILGYGFYLADAVTGSIHVSGPATLADIKIPDENTLAYMNFLTPRLKDLGKPGKNDADADLTLFGFSRPASAEDPLLPETETVSPRKEEIVFSYVLTLCFASSKKSFCVIDGKIYQPGGLLPDGGKILKIENDRVFISKQNKKEWLYPLSKRNSSSEKSEETI